jgi:hypothetical protein
MRDVVQQKPNPRHSFVNFLRHHASPLQAHGTYEGCKRRLEFQPTRTPAKGGGAARLQAAQSTASYLPSRRDNPCPSIVTWVMKTLGSTEEGKK